jgi:hypothetical protein
MARKLEITENDWILVDSLLILLKLQITNC